MFRSAVGDKLTAILVLSMNEGAKVVADAIIGNDFRTVIVGDKAYTIFPPTIHKLMGASSHLSQVKEGKSVHEVLLSLGDSGHLSKALSWLVCDNEILSEEFSRCGYEDVVNALEEALSLIDAKVFLKAVSLAKNVSLLTAKPK